MTYGSAISSSLLVLAAVACGTPADGPTRYGEEITRTDTTLVSQILADPDSHVGDTVLVTGTVVDVCSNRGCWLELASDREFETIRVKVEDGVIVFPLSARGRTAIVEGVVEKLTLTEAEALEQAQHHAEEQGEEFDPSAITGPVTTYQIRGLGALIDQ